MRVLIADPFPREHVTRLEHAGDACVLAPALAADDLPAAITDADALVVRSTRVTAGALDHADRLRLIIRAGSGVDTIDTDAATAAGIPVCNVPGGNAIAVAELAIGLLIAVDRRIADATADLRAGRWDKRTYAAARGLHGRTLAIVGMGAIGLAVAERAAALGMRLRTLARTRPAPIAERVAALGVHPVAGIEALAAGCDAITFHVPSTPQTRGIIGEPLLSWLRPGTIVLNTSRGDLIDPAALIRAMDMREIRVGLDVFPGEPASGRTPWDSTIAQHPNVTATPHIGASTAQAQEVIADEVVAIIDAFRRGTLRNVVNGIARPAAPSPTGS